MTFISDNDVDMPRHTKRTTRRKRYGIQEWSKWHNKWIATRWYLTKKARDQALISMVKHTPYYLVGHTGFREGDYRKVER